MSVEQAAAKLPELVRALKVTDEILLTTNDRAIAKIVPIRKAARLSRKPGSAKGILTIVSEDDEHLADFRKHM